MYDDDRTEEGLHDDILRLQGEVAELAARLDKADEDRRGWISKVELQKQQIAALRQACEMALQHVVSGWPRNYETEQALRVVLDEVK